jgi:excisionase family DNA binding protein
MLIGGLVMLEKYQDILNVNNVMEILGIGREAVYTLLKTNTIKATKIGRKWKITKEALEEYIRG